LSSNALVLGFDTSAAYCAAALLSGDRVLASISEDMKRGQAERLMPLLEQLLAQSGHQWHDLDAIGVGTGPGNFTGIRISVAAARGLALALDIPAIGVTTFAAISHQQSAAHIPVVPAPRDQLYAILPGADPALIAKNQLDHYDIPAVLPPAPSEIAANIARIAAANCANPSPPAAPFYIRAADAAPPRDPAPVILSDDS